MIKTIQKLIKFFPYQFFINKFSYGEVNLQQGIFFVSQNNLDKCLLVFQQKRD